MILRTLTMMAFLISSACVAHAGEDHEGISDSKYPFEPDEDEEPRATALYLISSAKDYVGQGKAMAYHDGIDGKFKISSNHDGGVSITFCGNDGENWWDIVFSAAEKKSLVPGIYKYAQRFPFNEIDRPGFAIYGCGRGCNMLEGEFEILEIKYKDDDEIESFAANFIQECEQIGDPLFGSVRYNSSKPIEPRFSEAFGNIPDSILYLYKQNLRSDFQSQPILITSNESDFYVRALPYGGEGLEVFIDAGEQGLLTLDFAAPLGEKLEERVYDYVTRYPFHSSVLPGIEISTLDDSFTDPYGEFKIIRLVKDPNGKIESLSLNFSVHNDEGDYLAGAIRFNSKFPVDPKTLY